MACPNCTVYSTVYCTMYYILRNTDRLATLACIIFDIIVMMIH